MKYFRFTRQDTLVLYIILPPYLMTVNYLLLGNIYFTFPIVLWATLVSFVIGFLSWASHIVTAHVIREMITGYSQTGRRILIQLPAYVLLTLVLGLSLFFAFHAMGYLHQSLSWSSFGPAFIAGILLNVVATSFHEGLFAFDKWKVSTLEAEQLKKNYLQSQLESLKSQVNPHFLFNSLNTLSALIYTDPDRASHFLDEMSKVYRYLLRANEHELIPLRTEMQFVHSFFHLLRTRYDKGINLQLDIQPVHLEYLLPPLTLQMLIENAVKHNVIAEDCPLQINIWTDAQDMLTVKNNIQPKATRVVSTGIGLQNIAAKYQLLNQSTFQIQNDGVYFTVQLPLFQPNSKL